MRAKSGKNEKTVRKKNESKKLANKCEQNKNGGEK